MTTATRESYAFSFGAHVVAFVVYVAVSYVWKSVFLNWVVGPLWLLAFLYLIPEGFRRAAARLRRPRGV